jgi:hypothetical protein
MFSAFGPISIRRKFRRIVCKNKYKTVLPKFTQDMILTMAIYKSISSLNGREFAALLDQHSIYCECRTL